MKYGELNLGQIEAIVNKLGGMDGVRHFLSSDNTFSITCEGIPTSELVRRGKYNWVNDFITDKLFPIEAHTPVTRTIELVEFDHDPTTEEALDEFTRHGLERPTYEDSLVFGIAYPKNKRKRPIIFLHEPVRVDGDRRVLVFYKDDLKRYLNLHLIYGRWPRNYIFAAVRKA